MAEQITYTLSIQLAGGPKLSASDTMQVEAYDKTQVTVAAGASDVEVNIQPGGAGLAQFLTIKASAYASGLTYKVNASTSTTIINLDGPHVLIGAGAVGLLDTAPTSLFFSNTTGSDVDVDILVGRDATP